MSRNYYDILSVSKSASLEEIKKNYKKLAKKYHPDMHPDDKEAESKFKELSEAYAILSDQEKRNQYDSAGHDAFTSSGQGYNFQNMNYDDMRSFNFGGSSFEDLFGDMFGKSSRRRTKRAPENVRGEDKLYAISVDLDDVINGSTIELSITRRIKCDKCSGHGADLVTCPTCSGRGRVQEANSSYQKVCSTCNGEGVILKTPCSECGSTGYKPSHERIKISLPKGVANKGKIRVTKKGDAGKGVAPDGDLYIEINIRTHPIYTRDGNNLYITVPIDIFEAMLGTKISVPTPYGEVMLNIQKGSNNDHKLRLKSKGMPIMKSTAIGDLIIILKIVTPIIDDEKVINTLKDVMKQTARPDRRELLADGKINS